MIATSESFASVESVGRGDNWLCYLPMGWVGDSMFSLSDQPGGGRHLQLPRKPRDGAARPARARAQRAAGAAAHLGEHADARCRSRRPTRRRLKRRVYEYFRGLAERRELLKGDGKPIPGGMRLGYRLGEYLVYGPVRDQLGLRNARWCLTGGAPLGADTFRFFRSFGINLKQIYGATEASALVCLPERRRGRSQHRRPHAAGHRSAHRRARRGAGQGTRRVPRLLQAGGGHARRHDRRTAGSRPATPASSIRAGTWPSSIAPRTSASSPTARRSRRSSSRTS